MSPFAVRLIVSAPLSDAPALSARMSPPAFRRMVPPCAVIELPRWIDRFEVMSTVFEPLRNPTETSLSAFTV